MKAILIIPLALVLGACTSDRGSLTPGYWSPSSPADPQARFGVLLEVNPVDTTSAK